MEKTKSVKVIATLPPLVGHREEIIGHQLVDELRFNTIMPISESPRKTLARLKRECGGKRLWVDLKARQLRITKYAYLPYAYVRLNHRIQVDLPATALFKEGTATIAAIENGNKLILADRPEQIVGDGQPINILSSSLRVEGFFTKRDEQYISAAMALDIHDYWLSFFESQDDADELLKRDPQANIVAKIESMKGMAFVAALSKLDNLRLMAARDDLFINMGQNKPRILKALKLIIKKDPSAIVASRILTSLEESDSVSLGDISDLTLMLEFGFRTIMLSDGLCFRRVAFQAAMRTLDELFRVLGGIGCRV
ncbi:hypothetical protein HZB94_05185 [Candidatus Falkowbacteria bacterium]|nr:hypothetical protein [Candidatus Falkowbacteria bacterium]